MIIISGQSQGTTKAAAESQERSADSRATLLSERRALLRTWEERFRSAFELQVPETPVDFKMLARWSLGHYCTGNAKRGVAPNIAVNIRYAHSLELWELLGVLLHQQVHQEAALCRNEYPHGHLGGSATGPNLWACACAARTPGTRTGARSRTCCGGTVLMCPSA
jgi:hypothetical protein